MKKGEKLRLAVGLFRNYFIFFIVAFFFIAYLAKSILLHWSLSSHSWDLGIFAQQTWLYSHTTSIYNTVRGTNLLSDHFGLILYLFAPIYRVFPRAETILVIQALLVSLSSLPFYLLAKRYLKSALVGCVLVIAFLSSYGIRSAISFDFHLTTIAVFFFSYFVYFWLTEKRFWGVVFAVLAMLCKEDVPVYVFFISAWFLFIDRVNKRKMVQDLILLFGSGTFFVAIMEIMKLIPSSVANFDYFSFNYLGKSYLDVIVNVITRPIASLNLIWTNFIENETKVSTFMLYLGGFWYIPLLVPDLVFASIPFFLTKFVSDRAAQWGISGQYAVMGMFLLSLAILFFLWRVIKRLSNTWGKAIIYFWSVGFLIFTFFYNFTGPNREFWDMFSASKWQEAAKYTPLRELAASVPEGASVASQDRILPHLASRREAYLYSCQMCNIPADKQYDYLLFSDHLDFEFFGEREPSSIPVINRILNDGSTEKAGNYELVKKIAIGEEQYYLFKNINK